MRRCCLVLVLGLAAALDPYTVPCARADGPPVEREVSLTGGLARLTVRDDYVSRSAYAGGARDLGVAWGTRQGDLWSHLALDLGKGTLSSHGTSADVALVGLRYGHEYALRRTRLLDRELEWWAGPALDVSMYLRTQQVADRTFPLSNFASFFLAPSAGASTTARLRLSAAWTLHAGATLALLGVGIKMVDFTKTDAASGRDPVVRLLLPWRDVRARGAIGAEWAAWRGLRLWAHYTFSYELATAWDLLAVGSDGLSLGTAYAW